MIQNKVNLKKIRHRDFKTDVYYCLMGPKGQHEALKTSLLTKTATLLPSWSHLFFHKVSFTHLHKIPIQFKFITIIKVNIY